MKISMVVHPISLVCKWAWKSMMLAQIIIIVIDNPEDKIKALECEVKFLKKSLEEALRGKNILEAKYENYKKEMEEKLQQKVEECGKYKTELAKKEQEMKAEIEQLKEKIERLQESEEKHRKLCRLQQESAENHRKLCRQLINDKIESRDKALRLEEVEYKVHCRTTK